MDSRVIKVQASSARGGPLEERRTEPPQERWPQPKGDLKAGRRCWEVRLPYSTDEAGERKDPVEGRGQQDDAVLGGHMAARRG